MNTPETKHNRAKLLEERRRELWQRQLKGEPITQIVREVAEKYGCSERTVWYDLKNIDQWLLEVADPTSGVALAYRLLGRYEGTIELRNTHVNFLENLIQDARARYAQLSRELDLLGAAEVKDKAWKAHYERVASQWRYLGMQIAQWERCVQGFLDGLDAAISAQLRAALELGFLQRQPLQVDVKLREQIRATAQTIVEIIKTSVPDEQTRDELILRLLSFLRGEVNE